MNWLKKLVVKWVREDWDSVSAHDDFSNQARPGFRKASTIAGRDLLNSDAQLTFTVYSAIGGKVVEFRRYDHKTDRSDNSMYVIGNDEDFGSKIAKIAMLEVMKN